MSRIRKLRRDAASFSALENGKREFRNLDADNGPSVFLLNWKFASGFIACAVSVPAFRKFDERRDVVRERVEQKRGAVFCGEELRRGVLLECCAEIKNFAVLRFGGPVDFGDGGAGDDVMKLIEQERFPCAVEFRRGVLSIRKHRAEEFGFGESLFAFPVSAFCAGLCGERAAVQLQIELAVPGREFRAVRFEKIKEAVGAVEFEMRNAFEILHAFSAFDEFRIRSAATVADAEEGEKVEDAVAFAAVVLRTDHSLGLKHGAVGVFGRKMGEHGGTVDSMPEEALVRETVELVPCDFCGEEAVASGFPENLRERGGVAEGVGQPEIADVDAEFIAEEILAVEELAHDGFSAGEHAVRFDPHSALDFPASGGDGLADFFVETGVVFLNA